MDYAFQFNFIDRPCTCYDYSDKMRFNIHAFVGCEHRFCGLWVPSIGHLEATRQ